MIRPFPPSVKWVFLDLDNTLWDFDGNANEALKELYKRHQLHLHTNYHVDQFVALYRDVNTAYWKRYEKGEVSKEVLRSARFTDTFNLMGVPAAIQPADIWQEYLDICPNMTRLMPNALESLRLLDQRFNLALLTNGFEVTQRIKIESSGIGEFVDFMVTSEALGIAKPNRDFFNYAIAKAGCKADEVVYLGDTWDTDVEGGMGAELLTYWYHVGDKEMHSENELFGGTVNDLLAFARL